MRSAALVAAAVAALAAAPVAPADADVRPLPGGDFGACTVDKLTTPPPQEPHTPMPCPGPVAP